MDLVPAEAEQVGVHHRDAGLARGLHQEAGDGLALVEQDRLFAADDPCRLEIGRVLISATM